MGQILVGCIPIELLDRFEFLVGEILNQSPTLGAHAHAHGFWVGMGAILMFMGGHGWA